MSAEGYVAGYAFGSAEAEELHKAARVKVATIDRESAVVERIDGYNRQRFRLDHSLTYHLTDLEKVVLAYGSPAPFGGYVNGVWVDVYTD